MPHNAAACIAALRAAMEALVVEVTQNPEIISQLDQLNEQMLSVIRQISRPIAAGINLSAGSTRLVSASPSQERVSLAAVVTVNIFIG